MVFTMYMVMFLSLEVRDFTSLPSLLLRLKIIRDKYVSDVCQVDFLFGFYVKFFYLYLACECLAFRLCMVIPA